MELRILIILKGVLFFTCLTLVFIPFSQPFHFFERPAGPPPAEKPRGRSN
jgi:hypothetical protein